MVFVLTVFVIMARFLTGLPKMSNGSAGPARLLRQVAAIVIVSLALQAAPIAAKTMGAQLSPGELRAELFGKTVNGDYANGLNWSETFNTDGTTIYTEAGLVLSGISSFQGNRICFRYREEPTAGGCFEVFKRSRNCYDFYSITLEGPNATPFQKQIGVAWDARAWRTTEPSTCVSIGVS